MSDIDVSVDLRPMFGATRDQGPRPTCLAFAASDAHAALRPGWVPLSCEYAFYHAHRRTARPPTLGAVLPAMLDALHEDGQPAEDGWPYLIETPENISAWVPPLDVGTLFGRTGQSSQPIFNTIVHELHNRRPVLALFTLSRSFFVPAPPGVVDLMPGEVPEAAQKHAVVAVGYGMVDGQGAVLVRNSWGHGWGLAGHAWLTESFLAPRLFATAILLDEVDVSTHPVTA